MSTFKLHLFSALLLLASCSDSATPEGGNSTGGNGSTPVIEPAIPRHQDPQMMPGKNLVDELLSRREDTTRIFLCDGTKKPQSETITKIIAQLNEKGIKFKQPTYPNYKYYLNRLVPIVRREGKVWVVHDHKLDKLTKVLNEQFFDLQRVELALQFDDATLYLVSNEFSNATLAYELTEVYGRDGTTTNMSFTKDGKYAFVSSKAGHIRWLARDGSAEGTALRMPRVKKDQDGLFSGGESGLIGMALHPEFATNRRVFIHYNWKRTDGTRSAIVSEWSVDMSKAPGEITFGNERHVFVQEQTHDNHNAGCMVFGPDGFLYIGIGDGEQGKWTIGRAPANSLRGKVLRIDVDSRAEGKQYGIPADNPFVGNDQFPPETWAWGFRNPWRLAFMPDGRLIASDIGEDVNEEITFVAKGKHHGWPYYEGLHERNKWTLGDTPLQPPLVAYGREYGMSSITGNVYDGDLPELKGKYVFCDYLSGRVWAFKLPTDMNTTVAIEDMEELTRWPLLIPVITRTPTGNLLFGTHTGQVMELAEGTGKPTTNNENKATKADPAMVRSYFGSDFAGPEAAVNATEAQINLGKRLFKARALSAGDSNSCSSCHQLGNFGQDGKKTAPGSSGPARNTPSIFNAHRQFAQFRDYRAVSVEDAVVESLKSHMGHAGDDDAAKQLNAKPRYKKAFAEAFPESQGEVRTQDIATAIGGFIRQLGTTSRWERFLDGDDKALSDQELIGVNEFISAGCTTCHLYRGLGGGMPQKLGLSKLWTGEDKGRFTIDPTPGQEYFFKVPSMFNVAKTAPYYHDGSMVELEDAVRNMAEIQLSRELNSQQVDSIVAFLGALTGERPSITK